MRKRQTGLQLSGFLIGSLALYGCSGTSGDGDDGGGAPPPLQQIGTAIAVTSSNRLVTINVQSRSASNPTAVTGLRAGENIIGIDIRPADSLTYALTNTGNLYTINTASGAATLKSTLRADPSDTSDPYTGLTGTDFGVDFNPVVDRLRVVSDTGQNLRINVDDGTTFTDNTLTVAGQTRTGISAVAYDTNFAAACRTVVSLIDVVQNKVLTSANMSGGVLTEVGNLGVNAAAVSGYEIFTPTTGPEVAVAALTVNGTPGIYTISLDTGAATSNGPITGLNAGEAIVGLTLAPPATPPTRAAGDMLAVTETNRLVSFNTGLPQKMCTSQQVSGLQAGERLLGIDTRPSNGQLYGLGSSGRIYTIDPNTGSITDTQTLTAADPSNPYTGLIGTEFGMQFNPVADQLRAISDAGINYRIDVNNGQTFLDRPMNPSGASVTALAYTNGFAGARTISAYVIDTQNDRLMSLGLGTGSAVNGDLQPIGPLNVNGDVGPIGSLEIDAIDSTAFAALNIQGAAVSELHSIDLTTGAATRLGVIEAGERVRAVTFARNPQARAAALTSTGQVFTFNPAMPGITSTPTTVTGLTAGESIVGLDYRPADGLLYAIGNSNNVYTLDAASGVATRVATLTVPLMGINFATDFNPVVDMVRIFSDQTQNIRAIVDDGTTVADGYLNRPAFGVTGIGYTNNFPGATATQLYALDPVNNVLLTIAPPAVTNDGTLTRVGSVGVDFDAFTSLEIAGANNAFAVLSTSQSAGALYSIDLMSGAGTRIGNVGRLGASDRVTGLALPPTQQRPAPNTLAVAIVNGLGITSFPLNAPSTAPLRKPITGLRVGETILDADIRPATGVLYALTTDARLYTINVNTGAATLIASLRANGQPVTLPPGNYGIDFNPVVDALRVTNDQNQNLVVIVDASAITPGVAGTTITANALNMPLSPIVPQPSVTAVGYTANYVGSPATRGLVLDSYSSSMFQVNTATGRMTLIGAVLDPTRTFSPLAGFDIVGGDDGLALAALEINGAGQSTLYSIDPRTGVGTAIGLIGPNGTRVVTSLAVQLQ